MRSKAEYKRRLYFYNMTLDDTNQINFIIDKKLKLSYQTKYLI